MGRSAQDLKDFAARQPDLVPFLDLLGPTHKIGFLKSTVKIRYDRSNVPIKSARYDEADVRRRSTEREVPLEYMLSQLTPEQRTKFINDIETRTDPNATAQSTTRLAAMKLLANFEAIDGFKLPAWGPLLEGTMSAHKKRFAKEEPDASTKTSVVSKKTAEASIEDPVARQKAMAKTKALSPTARKAKGIVTKVDKDS